MSARLMHLPALSTLSTCAALLCAPAHAVTADYSFYSSCGPAQTSVQSELPLSLQGTAKCENLASGGAGKREVSYNFYAQAGQVSGGFAATYDTTQYHNGGQQASVLLDNFMFEDSFTVVYDNPAITGPVSLTMLFDGQMTATGSGLGHEADGTLSLWVSSTWPATGLSGHGSRGLVERTGSFTSGSSSANLSPLTLGLNNGSVVTMRLFADFYAAGTFSQGLYGAYPDSVSGQVNGALSWWVEAPEGVHLISASGHDYTQRVSAVPEASSLAMLIGGLGVVGLLSGGRRVAAP